MSVNLPLASAADFEKVEAALEAKIAGILKDLGM